MAFAGADAVFICGEGMILAQIASSDLRLDAQRADGAPAVMISARQEDLRDWAGV